MYIKSLHPQPVRLIAGAKVWGIIRLLKKLRSLYVKFRKFRKFFRKFFSSLFLDYVIYLLNELIFQY